MRLVPPASVQVASALPNGSVFQAALGQRAGVSVVVKRLLPRVRDEAGGRAAIVREASFLARAHHRAVPTLHEVGTDEHGPFVVEGFVPGASLRAITDAWNDRGLPIPPPLLEHLVRASVGALAELHALASEGAPLDLSHGDLGPDHVYMSATGEIGFVDFGAARFAGMKEELETGDRGTLPFAAPEVARGEQRPDAAADVYALAATLLFAANRGRPLLEAEGPAMLLAIGERGLDEAIADRAEGLASATRDALRRAIAFERRARVTTAAELLAALSR